MRRLVCLVVLAGCATVVPYPTAREEETARRIDPTASVASLTRCRQRYVVKCSGCHALYSPREKTPEEWPKVLAEMTEKAKCGDDDRRAIELYLLAVSGTPETDR